MEQNTEQVMELCPRDNLRVYATGGVLQLPLWEAIKSSHAIDETVGRPARAGMPVSITLDVAPEHLIFAYGYMARGEPIHVSGTDPMELAATVGIIDDLRATNTNGAVFEWGFIPVFPHDSRFASECRRLRDALERVLVYRESRDMGVETLYKALREADGMLAKITRDGPCRVPQSASRGSQSAGEERPRESQQDGDGTDNHDPRCSRPMAFQGMQGFIPHGLHSVFNGFH